jgi:hypothetical protein
MSEPTQSDEAMQVLGWITIAMWIGSSIAFAHWMQSAAAGWFWLGAVWMADDIGGKVGTR